VANLIAKSPSAGHAPVEIGGATLSEVPPQSIWAIAPYHGQDDALAKALKKAHDLGWPAPGALSAKGGLSLAWSGKDQAFLFGTVPDPALSAYAALTDQSDAWTHLVLEGPATREVLARWVPVDLSPGALPDGSTIRTLLGHMTTLILHPAGDRFDLLVFRSMADTAWHELTHAMRAVAARTALVTGSSTGNPG